MINRCMFSCTCCQPSKSYTQKKSLFRHERITGIYEDPRVKDARERREAYAQAPKSCEACGVEFSYEDVVHGSKVKYCSIKCSISVTSKNRGPRKPTKHCVCCDLTLTNRASKYCSSDCANTERKTQTRERIDLGLVTERRVLKKYLTDERGWICEICENTEWTGDPIPLELDHIDGDASNNFPLNLRCICPNCHAKLPTSKGRNRGNGRKSRGLRL